MHPVSADQGHPTSHKQFFSTLAALADEGCRTLARLLSYVGVLALIGILLLAAWQRIGVRSPDGWFSAGDAVPEFALKSSDQLDKPETYAIYRHPKGGRRDIMRWGETSGGPALAELEIYRLGAEAGPGPVRELATRMGLKDSASLDDAGTIGSKFGQARLLRLEATPAAGQSRGPCLGFVKDIQSPAMRISGWSCHTEPAQRAKLSCMLNRLTLLGIDRLPDLADLFARAALRGETCGAAAQASRG